jgi:hypothetical protein
MMAEAKAQRLLELDAQRERLVRVDLERKRRESLS